LVVDQLALLIAVREASGAADAAGTEMVASNASLSYALTIYIIPHSLVTVSLTTVLFTRMSAAAAAGDIDAVRADLSYGVRTSSAFSLLATAVIVVLALPLTRLLLPGISDAEVQVVAPVLIPLALGLVPLGMTLLVKRVFFAFEDGRTVFMLSLPMSAVFIAFTLASGKLLPPQWWVVGIGLGQTLSFVAGAALRFASLRDRLHGLDGARMGWLHLRAGAAAALTGELGWLALHMFPAQGGESVMVAAAAVCVVGGGMCVVYLLLLRSMGVRELADFARPLIASARRRLKRGR
jgi:putative peptidoglycan lipid II flippase